MELRTTAAKVTLRSRTADILGYRELLVGLVRKELKVRYKNSVLGFVWSLVNPAVTIGVFYVIFSVVLKNAIPYFVLFLMSGVRSARWSATPLSSRRSGSRARSFRWPRWVRRSSTS
jgi:ABC-type polysaccharide/polyol phosphate export permease